MNFKTYTNTYSHRMKIKLNEKVLRGDANTVRWL